ncbi:C40 family peptidase [Romboutsia weinsteinii]|nr:NlpC/P60 family protein [Romboutsia weinsteinii]
MMKRKVIIPMASVMALSSGISVFANDTEAQITNQDNYEKMIYKTAKVTPNNGLNVRETPEVKDGNKITALTKGTELDILGKSDGWYKVEIGKEDQGWIKSDYVDLNNKSLYITGDRVNFREGSSLESNINKVLEVGTKLEFVEDQGEWIKVKYEDKEGYIYNKYISDEKPEIEETKQEVNNVVNVAPITNDQSNNDESSQEAESQTSNSENQQSTSSQPETSNKPENNEQNTNNKPEINDNKENSQPTNDSKEEETSQEESKPSVGDSNKQSSVVNLAYAQLGKPYVWGAEGPNAFDCSGLMTHIFKNGAGVNLPRTSKQQSNFGTTVDRSQLQPGDLIFSSTDGSGKVSHVGIYVGNGEMIHAPTEGDVVKKTNINSSYWNNAYLWAKRVL